MRNDEQMEKVIELILQKVHASNLDGTLDKILSMLGIHDNNMDYLTKIPCQAFNKPDGYILVMGYGKADINKLLGASKDLGISKSRLIFHLGFDEAQKVNINNFQWSNKYAAVLVGGMKHSGKGKENFSSQIRRMELEPGFPPVKRLSANSTLKIDKTQFIKSLSDLIGEGTISVA